ncbi:MAG: hypothetical protein CMJ77_23105 [Planctomycetaceae bacterium]|nr:hypothetical protein [Planctomycetaceae bacterium]
MILAHDFLRKRFENSASYPEMKSRKAVLYRLFDANGEHLNNKAHHKTFLKGSTPGMIPRSMANARRFLLAT